MAPFEDVSQWPVGRYLREVAAKQPDGRALVLGSAINFGAGGLLAVLIIMTGSLQFGTWLHVVLFVCVPFVGLVIFLRDMPSPQLTAFEHVIRSPWMRKVSTAFQVFLAALPWWVLAMHYAG
jgi:hypothetical protein